jgi:hypothetical protein
MVASHKEERRERTGIGPGFKDWEIALEATLDTLEALKARRAEPHPTAPHQTSGRPATPPSTQELQIAVSPPILVRLARFLQF